MRIRTCGVVSHAIITYDIHYMAFLDYDKQH